MLNKATLMIPGPTNVPERVLQAMNRPVINHRGPEYEALFQEICGKLQGVFQTTQSVYVYPAAGTGMMEAAVVNLLSPGDKVLVVSIGVFGDRLAEIAEKFGAEVEKLEFDWGCAADPLVLGARLAQDTKHEIKAVFMTHNETSTGVTNDIQALAAACGNHPALKIVDAVSSLAAIELKMDEWKLDAVFSGAQKALMLPPGLGFLAVSEKAQQAFQTSRMPKYYWDIARVAKSQAKWQNPYTPPVSLIFGLKESLTLIEEEGLAAIFARHQLLAKAVRAGVVALGLNLFAADGAASNGVTAVAVPQNVSAKFIQQTMRERFGISIAGGQQKLADKIFRIGHLGYVAPADVIWTLGALEMTLVTLKVPCTLGAGVKAAEEVLLQGQLLG